MTYSYIIMRIYNLYTRWNVYKKYFKIMVFSKDRYTKVTTKTAQTGMALYQPKMLLFFVVAAICQCGRAAVNDVCAPPANNELTDDNNTCCKFRTCTCIVSKHRIIPYQIFFFSFPFTRTHADTQ